MKKLLMLMGALIICNAYGEETIFWVTDPNNNNGYTTSTCTSGGNITKPENPQKEGGFRFNGWREATTDEINTILEIYAKIGATDYTPKLADAAGVTTWTDTFSYGTISGTRRCSSTNGTVITSGNPSTTNGKYCWCKLTDAEGQLSGLINVSSSPWVLIHAYDTASDCTASCVSRCATNMQSYRAFRKALFGLTQ